MRYKNMIDISIEMQLNITMTYKYYQTHSLVWVDMD